MAVLVARAAEYVARLDDPTQLMAAVKLIGDQLSRFGKWRLVGASPSGERLCGALMASLPECVETVGRTRSRVAIVDVVFCSGASVGAAAERARRQGPSRVDVFVLHDMSGGGENFLVRNGLVNRIVECQGSSIANAAVAASA